MQFESCRVQQFSYEKKKTSTNFGHNYICREHTNEKVGDLVKKK